MPLATRNVPAVNGSHSSTLVTVKYVSRVLLLSFHIFAGATGSMEDHASCDKLACFDVRPADHPLALKDHGLQLWLSIQASICIRAHTAHGAVCPHLPSHTVITVRPRYPIAEKVSHPPRGCVLPPVPNVQPQMAIPLPAPW